MKSILVLFGVLFLNWANAKTIVLIGQFHLSPNQITTDIVKSKNLPQFINQKTIYLVLDEWVKLQKLDLIIAEGCKGEINNKFTPSFNGWNYSDLNKLKNTSTYSDILTLIPLKIEAKYGDQIKVFCGDSPDLLKKHQLIFSDLKAYAGFYFRLKENIKNPKKFNRYLNALQEVEKRKIEKPIKFLRKKILDLIGKEKRLIFNRNKVFINIVKSSPDSKIAIVIGNRHIPNLKASLRDMGYKVQTIDLIQKTIPKNDYTTKLLQLINK